MAHEPTWRRCFPRGEYPNNFKAAIGGLAYAGPNRPIYQLLAGHKVLPEALVTKLEDKNGRERVIEWVGLAYLWDDEQLNSPIVQTIFAAGVEDVETVADLFWQVRRDELTDVQVERVLAFWERCLTWVNDRRARYPSISLAHFSRLSALHQEAG